MSMTIDKLKSELATASRVLRELEADAAQALAEEAKEELDRAALRDTDTRYQAWKEAERQAELAGYKRMAVEREVETLTAQLREAERQALLDAFDRAREPLETAADAFSAAIRVAYERFHAALDEHREAIRATAQEAGINVPKRVVDFERAEIVLGQSGDLKRLKLYPQLVVTYNPNAPRSRNGVSPEYRIMFALANLDGQLVPERRPVGLPSGQTPEGLDPREHVVRTQLEGG